MITRFALMAAAVAFVASPLFAQFDLQFESTPNGTTIDYVFDGTFTAPTVFGTTGINVMSTGANPIAASSDVINITGGVIQNVTQASSTPIDRLQFQENGTVRLLFDGVFSVAANDAVSLSGAGTFDLPSGDFSDFLIGVHDFEVSFPSISPAPVGTVEFVPEPTSALLVGAAGMLVLARRKRDHSNQQ